MTYTRFGMRLPKTRDAGGRLGALAAIAVLAVACRHPVPVWREAPTAVHRAESRSALDSGEPSREARRELAALDLEDRTSKRPALVEALEAEAVATGDLSPRAAAAELALLEARRLEKRDEPKSVGWALRAAEIAAVVLFAEEGPPAFDPRVERLRLLYARATARFASACFDRRCRTGEAGTGLAWPGGEPLAVTMPEGGAGLWSPTEFDELIPCDAVRFGGLRGHHRDPGIGAAMIGYRPNAVAEEKSRIEYHYPPEGVVRPVTAVVTFSRTTAGATRPDRVELRLFDPRRSDGIRLTPGRTLPLEVDWSAPYAYLMSKTELKGLGYLGTRKPARAVERQRVYLLEPYDPDKIPLLMIHGLLSSPLTWIELTNDLNADRRVRDRYQVWHAMYPAGLPYLWNASEMRREIELLRKKVDPTGDDPASRQMVIVAHSMGGLITKTLVSESGDVIWDAVFTVPPDELDVSEEDRERLREIFMFRPLPYVSRALFIAVPHRGSSIADGFVGWLGKSLIKLPEEFVRLFRSVTRQNPEAVRPEMRKMLAKGGPSSIQALSPNHPVLGVLADLPVDPRIPFHVLHGDRAGRGETDGVVPGWSSRMQGAASEATFESGHDVHAQALAVREILRILRLPLPDPPPGS